MRSNQKKYVLDEFMPRAHPVDLSTAMEIEREFELKKHSNYPGIEQLQKSLNDRLWLFGCDCMFATFPNAAQVRKSIQRAASRADNLAKALDRFEQTHILAVWSFGAPRNAEESAKFIKEREAVVSLRHRLVTAAAEYSAYDKPGPKGFTKQVRMLTKRLLTDWKAWTGKKGWPSPETRSQRSTSSATRYVARILRLCDQDLTEQQVADLIDRILRSDSA